MFNVPNSDYEIRTDAFENRNVGNELKKFRKKVDNFTQVATGSMVSQMKALRSEAA